MSLELDRIVDALVRVLSERPQGLIEPFTVEELVQQILPYRRYRSVLGFETVQDYEVAVMRLLAGEGRYLSCDPATRTALESELQSTNPDPTAYRAHGRASVAITPAALERAARVRAAEPDASGPRPAASGAQPGTTQSSPLTQAPAPMPSQSRTVTADEVGGSCRHCGGALPAGRRITFCPSCGQNVTVLHCPACSSELEVGWKFCITCGRSMAAT